MRNLKLIVLAASMFLFMGTNSACAQDQEPQTVIIKMHEVEAMFQSKMIVTKPNGETISTDLMNPNFKHIEEATGHNNVLLQTELNNWKSLGFKIDATYVTIIADMSITTLILSKD